MAAADKNASKSKADKGDKPKGGKSLLTIGLVAVIAAGAAGAGAWYFATQGTKQESADAPKAKKPGEVPAPAQYFALEPPFVVNLVGETGGARYLQVEVQLMTRDPEAMAAIQLHAPAIRARLLMLFAQQDAASLMSREGKERLQNAALGEVKSLLVAETGQPSAESILFTSFVMQ
ncbi:flagellar basal body-associated FliL family protein [Pseudoxanthomonas sp. LH2527]|uniref:flagellar basal body-associated FliL family protein n=1 Tax=Pseudoxanthomonas sp. LH2527 TaxID=2923249 RepID=UPI001F13F0F3|nr:flagellar basal body-associated FliL family protein [uncultured Pseudoxanthomonas sp.]MCH6485406.1 flagellar basal body-associated FliL family protein [Pseudoxanthomonas sp. LH2527]